MINNTVKIGLIGAGKMGGGIAKNLLKAGFGLTVHKRNLNNLDEASRALQHAGARLTDSTAEVFASSELLLTCLPTSVEVEGILSGKDGPANTPNSTVKTVVDFSTARPESTRMICRLLGERNITMLDAPMTGGPTQADEGNLNLAVGGDKATFDELCGTFDVIAKNIVYAGPSGAGNCLKLANNFMGLLNRAVASFSALLMEKEGIKPQRLVDFVSVSGGYSRGFESQMAMIMEGTFPLGFALDLALKDIRYMKELADARGLQLGVLENFLALLTDASAAGYGGEDMGTVYKYLRESQ